METEIRPIVRPDETPPIAVSVAKGTSPSTSYRFTTSFRIGRDKECDIWLDDPGVSRTHLEAKFEDGRWWIRDLQSRNGVYKDGKKVDRIPVARRAEITLGGDGPVLIFEVEGAHQPDTTVHGKPGSVTEYVGRYFEGAPATNAGQHTLLLRRAFEVVARKRSKKYMMVIAVVGFLFVCAAVYAVYTHTQVQKQKTLAAELFYELKDVELSHARLRSTLGLSVDTSARSENAEYLRKRAELLGRYERFVEEVGVYEGMDDREKAIYKVAGAFGECEVNVPKAFVDDVKNYIEEWKLSPRLKKALRRARENGFGQKIAEAMLREQLPPHFFFLALQESDFDVNTVGPSTRYGIAKGMWQFIPTTATEYGLRTGPLVSLPRPDPLDERHNFEKSTAAAAKYLRDIYETEAQASGLLVCASYNWGHNVVRGLIKKMPPNPRDRNFWSFYETYQKAMPKQTYDYVFYIVSAAAISENPRAFGFDFENPLSEVQPLHSQ